MNEQLYIIDRVQIVDGCWLWTSGLDTRGYGQTSYNGPLSRKYGTRVVHRLSYMIFVGPIPDGLLVRHKCRNKHCCNPEHLEPGTVQENNADKYRDGTILKGEANHKTSLTEQDVLRLRSLAGQYNQKELAELFEVSCPTVHNIIHRKTWKHI